MITIWFWWLPIIFVAGAITGIMGLVLWSVMAINKIEGPKQEAVDIRTSGSFSVDQDDFIGDQSNVRRGRLR